MCNFYILKGFMEFSVLDIIERIKNQLSVKELESLGYTPQIISNWKSRNTIPRSDDLYKIAQAIGVSMEYLLTGNDEKELPPDKIELLKNYDLLSDDLKAIINIQIAALTAKR